MAEDQWMTPSIWTIGGTYARVMGIYSTANALTMHGSERLNFLFAACGDVSRCYRKKQVHLYPIAIAQVVAWYMSLGEGLFRERGGDILTTAMGEKYPWNRCGYCGQYPCQCKEERRAEHQSAGCAPEQRLWTLRMWQAHLNELYGRANKEGGVWRSLNRLLEETVEISLVLHYADGFNDSLLDMQRKYSLEMTDVLAWLFGVASLLEVDVESAIAEVYELGCPVCGEDPCSCRNFERRPIGTLTHRFMSAEDIYTLMRAKTVASA